VSRDISFSEFLYGVLSEKAMFELWKEEKSQKKTETKGDTHEKR